MIGANSILTKYLETTKYILKSTKMPGKLSFTRESVPDHRRTLLQDISLIIVCFFFTQINLVLKLNLVLIRSFSPKFICIFTFDIMCVFEFIQSLHVFFIKTSKILMRLKVVFADLQPQNILIIFLFSMKNSYVALIIFSDFYMV